LNADDADDSQAIYGSIECCAIQAVTNRGKLFTLVAAKRQHLLLMGDDDEVFMIRSQSTLRRRQQSSI